MFLNHGCEISISLPRTYPGISIYEDSAEFRMLVLGSASSVSFSMSQSWQIYVMSFHFRDFHKELPFKSFLVLYASPGLNIVLTIL